MARRTLTLSKGGTFRFMRTNCTALSIGVAKTLSLPSRSISTTSFGGNSFETSASPRSSSARRDAAEGATRQMTRSIFGSGPDFQLSKRTKLIESELRLTIW